MRKRRLQYSGDGFYKITTLGSYNAPVKEEYIERDKLDDTARKLVEAYYLITGHGLEGYIIEL
jgi:hypothetical protein